MQQDVRFIVFSGNEAFVQRVRPLVSNMAGAKLVGEIDEVALLSQTMGSIPADVVLVDLDPDPEVILPFVGEVVKSDHGVAVFAVSECSDGHLILRTIRMGVKEFLPKPLDEKALQEAVDRIIAIRPASPSQGTLISVVGASGGVGTTLLTTSVACELVSLARGQVTLVDLDYRFGQVATFLDVDPRHTLSDLCSSPEQLEDQLIERVLSTHTSGVRVLSRPLHLAETEMITAAACTGVLSALVLRNEYVIADGPMRYDVGSKPVLSLSDIILVVVEPLVPCVHNAQRLLGHMRESGINMDRVNLICNRMGSTTEHLSAKDIEETLGQDTFACVPDEWDIASGAINLGEPLMTHSPKSKLCQAIKTIARRIHSPNNDSEEVDSRKPSLIGRIFAGA